MGSYIFFAKDIFGVDELSRAEYPVIEKIILWNTLFEDRSILKEKLQDEFGPSGNGMLDAEQIKRFAKAPDRLGTSVGEVPDGYQD